MSAMEADERDDDALAQEPAEDAAVSIFTRGDPIRSFARLLSPIVDECRLRFDEDGMHVTAVDAPNVSIVDVTAPAEGFGRYQLADDVDAVTFGLNLARFRRVLKWARKRGDGDPVALDVWTDPARIRVRIVREDARMVRRSEWFGIDPDGMREIPNTPGLDLPNRARPGVDALNDAVSAIYDEHDHARVTRDGETFIVSSMDDSGPEAVEDDADAVTMLGCAWDERDDTDADACSSLFSLDYLADIVKALKRAKADRVTVQWADDFPTKLRFEHEEWGFSGQYMLAPRMESEDDDD